MTKQITANALHTFRDEYGMEVLIFTGRNGCFDVCLRDMDSGLLVSRINGYATETQAVAKAMEVIS